MKKEVGVQVAPRAYASQMLKRSGLSRFDQRAVLANCQAEWDAKKIKIQLETIYKSAEMNDKQAVQKGRNFRKGHRKTFHVGVTELEPADVECDSDEEKADLTDFQLFR